MVRAQLASCARERVGAAICYIYAHGHMHAGHACLVHHSGSLRSYNSDDGGKYSASEERTFSRSQGVVRVPCRYLGPRECVHIKLLVSSVSFSHNNVRLLMVYVTQSLLTARLAVSEIKPVQTERQTDRHYSNSRCACARGLTRRMLCIMGRA